jgi:thiol:disulfide interchange protein
MTARRSFASSLVALAIVLPGCKETENTEGIRPEISALPPELRPQAGAAARGGETWNAAQIDWQPYEAGLARAKAQKKPVCLVFYTNWCPHCRNFSHVFDDPKVALRSKDFVMIHANAEEEAAVANQYAKDGVYVPRTFFLSPDGVLDPELHAPRPKFLYFYDERDPGSLLAGMEAALRKLGK